tara:strand:- start:715 stop:1302 length:588 start_codon:yes stop_codon:yes gene_type:complete
MNTRDILKINLKRLIPAIRGDWFLSDGGLLGIERQGNLLEWDNDLDIYLLPGSSIDIDVLRKQGLDLQDYYMDTKVYDPSLENNNLKTWSEYMGYTRVLNKDIKLNRCQLMKLAAIDYKEKKIKPKFTVPYIDVYYLRDDLSISYWDIKYDDEDMELEENFDLGFKIYIPNNRDKILKKLYGEDWRIPNPDFQHV